MDIIHSVAALRERLQREPNNVFVPTMGNLHEGHIELIRIAKPRAACTVVSIFVNRLQFGPREDFDRYPRTLAVDSAKLQEAGVDVVFAPDEKRDLSGAADLRRRAFGPAAHPRRRAPARAFPRRRDGGAEALQSRAAAFGDIRQEGLPAISRAARHGAAVRAADRDHSRGDGARGRWARAVVAQRLFDTGRARGGAAALSQVLREAERQIRAGARDYQRIELEAMAELAHHGWRPDYIAVRRQADLQPPENGGSAGGARGGAPGQHAPHRQRRGGALSSVSLTVSPTLSGYGPFLPVILPLTSR